VKELFVIVDGSSTTTTYKNDMYWYDDNDNAGLCQPLRPLIKFLVIISVPTATAPHNNPPCTLTVYLCGAPYISGEYKKLWDRFVYDNRFT